jgi:hypothetical protein
MTVPFYMTFTQLMEVKAVRVQPPQGAFDRNEGYKTTNFVFCKSANGRKEFGGPQLLAPPFLVILARLSWDEEQDFEVEDDADA